MGSYVTAGNNFATKEQREREREKKRSVEK
jgi:hypothetical protein